MARNKPIILFVELSDVLRLEIGEQLQADMPTHTVMSVGNYAQASRLFARCRARQEIPLVITEARPLVPEGVHTAFEEQYGSANAFIGEALDAGASVILFTAEPVHVTTLEPASDSGSLSVVFKPNYDDLRDQVFKMTSAAPRSSPLPVVAEGQRPAL